MLKCSYVYLIRNLKNNRAYVGLSTRPIMRWSEHVSNLKHSTHCNSRLQDDWHNHKIHDWEFRILEEVVGVAHDRESHWIEVLKADSDGYNVAKVNKYERHERVLSLIGTMTYRDIAKQEGVSLGFISKVKDRAAGKI